MAFGRVCEGQQTPVLRSGMHSRLAALQQRRAAGRRASTLRTPSFGLTELGTPCASNDQQVSGLQQQPSPGFCQHVMPQTDAAQQPGRSQQNVVAQPRQQHCHRSHLACADSHGVSSHPLAVQHAKTRHSSLPPQHWSLDADGVPASMQTVEPALQTLRQNTAMLLQVKSSCYVT